jgi:hypothetical protein
MKINAEEIKSVINLPGEKRYKYFIKKIADQNQVWGLWNEGWAMGVTDDGTRTIPVWPAKEYARLCQVGDWSNFHPKPIPLQELIHEMLPDAAKGGIRVSIFDTPNESSVLVSDEELVADLEAELSKIE